MRRIATVILLACVIALCAAAPAEAARLQTRHVVRQHAAGPDDVAHGARRREPPHEQAPRVVEARARVADRVT